MNLTSLEKKVMLGYDHLRNYDSAKQETEDNAMLADAKILSRATGLPIKVVRSIVGGLAKKGLVFREDDTGDGKPGYWITESGIEALYELIQGPDQTSGREPIPQFEQMTSYLVKAHFVCAPPSLPERYAGYARPPAVLDTDEAVRHALHTIGIDGEDYTLDEGETLTVTDTNGNRIKGVAFDLAVEVAALNEATAAAKLTSALADTVVADSINYTAIDPVCPLYRFAVCATIETEVWARSDEHAELRARAGLRFGDADMDDMAVLEEVIANPAEAEAGAPPFKP